MKIYLTDQAKHFPEHLQRLKQEAIIPYDTSALKEQTSTVPINSSKDLRTLAVTLFDYNIFPPNIMSHLCEWSHEGRPIKPGDTIVQQVFIPPIKAFSQKIIFGVRIRDVINEDSRVGFGYETLIGHVEKGISTFTIERAGDSETIFRIHTFSAPATFLTRLLGPVFSRPYQTYCTHQALAHVKAQLQSSPISK